MSIFLMKGEDISYMCLLLLILRTFYLQSDARASVFSDVFARVESRFHHFQSVVHDPRARVAAISAVDEEINAVMQLLHSLRNALASISLLPPEVLSRIFHFLSLKEPSRVFSRPRALGWILATHVCRHWRQVAIGDSSLWAEISGVPANRELVSEMLARARNTPLDIIIDLDGVPDPKVLLDFFPHLSHTRELCLSGLDLRHLDSVQGICSQEVPALEHFQVEVSPDELEAPLVFQELDGTTLFKGQAPKLRTISLFYVFIPWSFIPRGQLTELEICHNNEILASDIGLRGDLNQLIDLLVNCPQLEVLVLRSCLYPQPTHFSYGQTIHLPLLSRLHLVGPTSRVTNLLKMLKLSSSTTLQLYCGPEDDWTHNHNLVLPVVSAHLQSAVPIGFKRLSVTITGTNRWLIVTASTSFTKSRISQSEEFESDMEKDFVLSFNGWLREGLIEQICKILPISSLEFLSISAIDEYGTVLGPVNWAELFKSCVEITTMEVIGRGTSSFVRALTAPKLPKLANMRHGGKEKKLRHDSRDSTRTQQDGSTAPHAHTPIFPKLTFLSLKKLDFGESKPPGILFDVLQNGLRQRRVVYGTPLKMLCIDECAISTKRAKALEEHVERLLWDGEVGMFRPGLRP